MKLKIFVLCLSNGSFEPASLTRLIFSSRKANKKEISKKDLVKERFKTWSDLGLDSCLDSSKRHHLIYFSQFFLSFFLLYWENDEHCNFLFSKWKMLLIIISWRRLQQLNSQQIVVKLENVSIFCLYHKNKKKLIVWRQAWKRLCRNGFKSDQCTN